MAAQYYKINYKSDFVLTINSDAGWAVPFCIKFWTGMPSHGYFAGFDGENYVNCRVGETPTQLLVMFDDHHMPIGPLRMQIAYHTTIEEFPDRKFDEVTNPTNVTVDIDGTEYQVMLDFTGETGAEIDFSMPSSGVMSVNGKIGYVTLNAEDVGAQPTIEDLATIRSGAAAGSTAVQPATLQEGLAGKQDTISDLATIRSGAAAGATAYQKPGTGIPESDLASGVQSSLHKADAAAPQSNTYTKGEVDTLIAGAGSDIDVDDALSTTSENPVQNKVVTTALNGKQATISDLATIRSGAAAGATAVQPATLQEGLAGKQDTISDLATIRSGAAAGATAVQPAALTPIESDIDAIEGKIPSAASASNQLADKAFVNSALSGKADTSDIPTALSQLSQDSTHRVVTDAEKSTWNGKQNAINDLATIRSGAAAGATAVQPSAMNTALAAKQDTLTFDNTPTANSNNPVKSGGIKTALDAKQSTINTVNVTVDNNTGTPSGSASVSGSTLSLNFQNLKGATGATGATGPQGPQGERGLPGESGVTGDVSAFTVIQTIDPSATYGPTDIAGAATVQATNQELTELSGIADDFSELYVHDKSTNLYDGTTREGYIGSSGTISTQTGGAYLLSTEIPIEPNTYYYLSGRTLTAAKTIRCLDANGNILKVLAAATGVAHDSYYYLYDENGTSIVTNGQFLTPPNAVSVSFTIRFNSVGTTDRVMLYKIGTSYIANYPAPQYEAYYDNGYRILDSVMPPEYNEMLEDVSEMKEDLYEPASTELTPTLYASTGWIVASDGSITGTARCVVSTSGWKLGDTISIPIILTPSATSVAVVATYKNNVFVETLVVGNGSVEQQTNILLTPSNDFDEVRCSLKWNSLSQYPISEQITILRVRDANKIDPIISRTTLLEGKVSSIDESLYAPSTDKVTPVLYSTGWMDATTGAVTGSGRRIVSSTGWVLGNTIIIEKLVTPTATSVASVATFKNNVFVETLLTGTGNSDPDTFENIEFTPTNDFDEVRFSLAATSDISDEVVVYKTHEKLRLDTIDDCLKGEISTEIDLTTNLERGFYNVGATGYPWVDMPTSIFYSKTIDVVPGETYHFYGNTGGGSMAQIVFWDSSDSRSSYLNRGDNNFHDITFSVPDNIVKMTVATNDKTSWFLEKLTPSMYNISELDKRLSSEIDNVKYDAPKVLLIGSSHGMNTVSQLPWMLYRGGYKNVVVGNVYHGSFQIQELAQKISNGTKLNYQEFNTNGTAGWGKKVGTYTIDALLDKNWDVISLQRAALDCEEWNISQSTSFGYVIDYISTYCRTHNLNTPRLLFNSGFADRNADSGDSMTHTSAIIQSAKQMKAEYGIEIVPTGIALRNARATWLNTLGATTYLCYDSQHLDYGIGCWVASAALFESVMRPLGRSVATVNGYGTQAEQQVFISVATTTNYTEPTAKTMAIAKACVLAAFNDDDNISSVLKNKYQYPNSVTIMSNWVTIGGTDAQTKCVATNGTYNITFEVWSGATLSSVKVVMNGTDITSTAYDSSTSAISIPSVSGDIEITILTTT